MKKYSIEELKNLDRAGLITVSTMIIDGKADFGQEEWMIIEDKLRKEIEAENSRKLYTMAEAAEILGMSENELTDALTREGFGDYVLTEDQGQNLQ